MIAASDTSHQARRLRGWHLRLLSLLGFALAWEWFGVTQDSLLLPTFTATLGGLWSIISSGAIWGPLFVSNQALVIGLPLALLAGLPLGLAMGRARTFDNIASVYLAVALVTPMAGLLPILVMAFGPSLTSRVLVIFIFSFPFIAANARAGTRSIDGSLLEMATSFNASEAQIWRFVLLPGALPGIMAGIRIGLAQAILGMVVAEMLLVAVGIGRLLLFYQGRFEAEHLFAVVLIVVAQSLFLLELAKRAEGRFTAWAASARRM